MNLIFLEKKQPELIAYISSAFIAQFIAYKIWRCKRKSPTFPRVYFSFLRWWLSLQRDPTEITYHRYPFSLNGNSHREDRFFPLRSSEVNLHEVYAQRLSPHYIQFNSIKSFFFLSTVNFQHMEGLFRLLYVWLVNSFKNRAEIYIKLILSQDYNNIFQLYFLMFLFNSQKIVIIK